MELIARLSPYFIVVGAVGFFIVLAYFVLMKQRANEEERRVLGKVKTNNNFRKKMELYGQKAYNVCMRIPILNRIVRAVRKKIETLSIYDEYSLRREVMRIMFTILALILIIVTLLMIIRPSFMVTFWILLGSVFVSGLLIDFFVHRVELKLLTQIKEFNGRVRFAYQQTKMVGDSIQDAIPFCGPEMKVQAERIYDILTAIEPEQELAKYEEVAPSRFLKVMAGLSLLVKEHGDQVSDEKGSAYLRSLNAINEELNNEITYRKRLSYEMRSLSTLTVVPIFFALPLKNWAIKYFPVMQSFYDSGIGFLVEIAVYVITLACYLVIRKMRSINEVSHPINMKRNHWEKKVFDKAPFIERFCLALSPTPYTKKYFKRQKLMKEANSPLKMEWLTFHRVLIGLVAVILLSGSFLYSHIREEKSVLYKSVPSSLFAGELSAEETAELDRQTEFDRQLIKRWQEADKEVTADDIKKQVASTMGLEPNDPKVEVAFDRVNDKWETVKTAYFKWWEFLCALILAYAAAYIPIWNLHFKRSIRYKEMELEVHQHLVLISSLREFDHMTARLILEWMTRFSIVFKEPLQVARLNFDSGSSEALDELSKQISFEPFQQIIKRLELSLNRISIKEAFDDIDTERVFYLEQRKDEQKQSIEERGVLGKIVGMLPMAALVFLYLVVPLIYISVVKTSETMAYFQ